MKYNATIPKNSIPSIDALQASTGQALDYFALRTE